MSKLDFLLNDNYKILNIIQENTVELMDTKYCPLSQEQIASIAGINRITCGNIINKLKDEDLVDKNLSANKHYILTEDALSILKKLNKI